MATFALLHGAWHGPSCWELLTPRLEALGHSAVCPDLPLDDPEAGYLRRVQPAVEALDGVDGEVLVVGHSQSSGLGALVAATRPVSLLVHLCPRMGTFELPDGAPINTREGFPFPPARADGATVWDPEAAKAAMYRRLPAGSAAALAKELRPMAMPPDDYSLREHPEVPTALIYATDDEIFEPAFERFVASELLGIDPIELSGGHFQMIEEPDRLAQLLDRLARGGAVA